MKRIISLLFCIGLFFSCGEGVKQTRTLSEMEKSFKVYIKQNDTEKQYETNIRLAKAISYEEIAKEDARENEVYRARIFFMATTSEVGSALIYNINDTVTCYFDKNLEMKRLENSK